MLRRPRRCRCSRTGWRHTCSAAVTKLFDFINISYPSHYFHQNSGPCRSFYCLGHYKNVYDDDVDDDDVAKIAQRIDSQPYAKLYNNIPFHVPHLNPCEIVPHFPVPHFHVSHFQRPRLSVCYTHLYIRQPMDSRICHIAILFKLNASLPAIVVKFCSDNISTINIMQLLTYKRVS